MDRLVFSSHAIYLCGKDETVVNGSDGVEEIMTTDGTCRIDLILMMLVAWYSLNSVRSNQRPLFAFAGRR